MYRPACRMNQTGVQSTGSRRQARKNRSERSKVAVVPSTGQPTERRRPPARHTAPNLINQRHAKLGIVNLSTRLEFRRDMSYDFDRAGNCAGR
jgi:hypothetical protein